MSSSPVICDTSPLIALVGVGQLDLLPRLYGAVLIPRQVLNEFNAGAAPTDPDLGTLTWISVVDNVTLDPNVPSGLGQGERAAISLALRFNARLILIDEIRARNVARNQGLRVAGTLAVVLGSKQRGLVPTVKPIIDRMHAQGRRFSPNLLADVLRLAGE